MKKINLEPTGLLWRLATVYGPMCEFSALNDGADICEFTRAVLRGIISVFSILLVGSIVAVPLASAGAFWLAALVVGAMPDLDTPAILGSILVVGVAIAAAVVFLLAPLIDAINRYRYRCGRLHEKKQPSQLRLMYDAWKSKYCFRIEFKDQDAA